MIRKSDIQAIYPLLPKQSELAFFSLQPDIADPGFIQLRFTIEGPLDQQAFDSALQRLSTRHESLRMSLQSPKQKKSMLVVCKQCELSVEWLDISDKSHATQKSYLTDLESDIAARGLDLSTPSVNRLVGVKTSDTKVKFFWACHHLLVDGWSSIILLKDLAHIYSNERNGTQLTQATPSTYGDYLGWLKNQSDQVARDYWTETLKGYKKHSVLSDCFRTASNQSTTSKEENLNFEVHAESALNSVLEDLAAEHKVTPATVVYSAWAIYLAALTRADDVVFGTSTAGRMFDLPGSQKMTGYFSNVIPRRFKLDKSRTFIDLILEANQSAFASLEFEYTHLEKIQSCSEIPPTEMLFDHLVLFENLPLDDILLPDPKGDVRLGNFSGGQTTRYPLTLSIKPGSNWRFRFLYQPDFDSTQLQQLFKMFPEILFGLCTKPSAAISALYNQIPRQHSFLPAVESRPSIKDNPNQKIQLARNKTELAIAGIWEELLGISSIDIHKEFIALGGRSIIAVKMLAQIETRLGVKLSMRDMVQEPTIAAIAKHIDGDAVKEPWTSLIPLKPVGGREPVIFVNGARGHALFMRSVTQYFDKDRPVIGMQLPGLDGECKPLSSVEEISDHFLGEILAYQSSGPYNLVAHCFGVAVVHEMVLRLEAMGEKVGLIVVLDASPPNIERGKSRFEKTLSIARQGENKMLSRFASLGLRIVKNIHYQCRERLHWFGRNCTAMFGNTFEKSEARFDLVYNALVKTAKSYIAKPIDNRVVLISSLDNPDPRYAQWRETTSNLEIVKLPVRHIWMFTEPEAAILGKSLSDLVEKRHKKMASHLFDINNAASLQQAGS